MSRYPLHARYCMLHSVLPDFVLMACASAADAGGGRPTPALRSKSGSLRPTKSELLQDKKSRTGKTSTRTSKKDGAGCDTLNLLPTTPACCCRC